HFIRVIPYPHPAPPARYALSLHDALPICRSSASTAGSWVPWRAWCLSTVREQYPKSRPSVLPRCMSSWGSELRDSHACLEGAKVGPGTLPTMLLERKSANGAGPVLVPSEL